MSISALIYTSFLWSPNLSFNAEAIFIAFSRPFHLLSPFRSIAPCCFLSGLHPFALSATVHALSKTGPYRTYGFLTDFLNTTSCYVCFSMHLACPSFARYPAIIYVYVIYMIWFIDMSFEIQCKEDVVHIFLRICCMCVCICICVCVYTYVNLQEFCNINKTNS